jgi:hypothetical protein
MNVLELARKAYARVRAERNGYHDEVSSWSPRDGEKSEISEISLGGSHTLIRSMLDLPAVLQALDESVQVGLDLETTGLDPRTDRVRLLSLSSDRGTYLVDCFAADPRPLFEMLAEKELVVHNGLFDLGFLARMGFTAGAVVDTMLTAQLLLAGTHEACSLQACVQRELRITLDKDLQKADWTRDVSEEQLAYAAQDAALTRRLAAALGPRSPRPAWTRSPKLRAAVCRPWCGWPARESPSIGTPGTAWPEMPTPRPRAWPSA